MIRPLRIIRGILSTAILWATAWFLAGSLFAAIVFAAMADVRESGLLATSAFAFGLFFGLVGAFTGATFAVTMAVSERRTQFASLSMRRVVAWGALGGLLYPALAWLTNLLSAQSQVQGLATASALGAMFGGTSAGAMLAIARRAQGPSTDAHAAELEAPKVTEVRVPRAGHDNIARVAADDRS